LGGGGSAGFIGGLGAGSESPASAADRHVDCALEWNTSTTSSLPSRLRASARGSRPGIGITTGAAARLLGSYPLTASSCDTLT
jgi:hypothetical protein